MPHGLSQHLVRSAPLMGRRHDNGVAHLLVLQAVAAAVATCAIKVIPAQRPVMSDTGLCARNLDKGDGTILGLHYESSSDPPILRLRS